MLRSLIRRLSWTATGVRQAPRPFRYAVLEHISGRRTFAKTYPDHTRLEFLRGQAICEAAARTGLFQAPKPLELIESQNIIIWEYLPGLVEARDYILADGRRTPEGKRERSEFLFTTGRGLAALHEGLMQIPCKGEFSPLPEVKTGNSALDRHVAAELSGCTRRPLHWDYCCGNVFVSKSGNGSVPTLVILDAMPNHYVLQKSGPDVLCPIYVDIAQMIFSICCHPRFSRAIQGESDDYVAQFLAGYSKESGVALDLATAYACTAELTRVFQRFIDRGNTEGFSISSWRDRRFRAAAEQRLQDSAIKALPARETAHTLSPTDRLAKI
jgi:hypothetical protein